MAPGGLVTTRISRPPDAGASLAGGLGAEATGDGCADAVVDGGEAVPHRIDLLDAGQTLGTDLRQGIHQVTGDLAGHLGELTDAGTAAVFAIGLVENPADHGVLLPGVLVHRIEADRQLTDRALNQAADSGDLVAQTFDALGTRAGGMSGAFVAVSDEAFDAALSALYSGSAGAAADFDLGDMDLAALADSAASMAGTRNTPPWPAPVTATRSISTTVSRIWPTASPRSSGRTSRCW